MYATCAALGSVKPNRKRIAGIDASLLTDILLDMCYKWLRAKFEELGGNDQTAKGPTLAMALRQHIIEEYGVKKSAEEKRLKQPDLDSIS